MYQWPFILWFSFFTFKRNWVCWSLKNPSSSDILWSRVFVQTLSHVQLFGTPWTVAPQAPLSMGFSRQGYWSGLPFSLGDLPNPGIKPESLVSPALVGRFFTTALRSLPALTVYDPDTWVVCKWKACTQAWHFVADKAPSHPCHLILRVTFWRNRTGVLLPVRQVQNLFLIFIFLTPRTFCIGVQLINNCDSSGEQWRDSAIHIHGSILPPTLLPSREASVEPHPVTTHTW